MNENEAVSKLWKAFTGVENYFQTGLGEQLQNSTSFDGNDAIPIRNAYTTLKETEPFIPNEISNLANISINIAAHEFNKFLDVLRHALLDLDEKKKMEIVNSALNHSLEVYRLSLVDLRSAISLLEKEDVSSSIIISGDNYGQLNVAGKDIISPAMNMTLSNLIHKIDESDLRAEEKESLKDKINSVISHPLLTSILGGVAGGAIG